MPTPVRTRVLVVDDDLTLLRTIVRLLDRLGAEAVPVVGLAEAVAQLRTQPPDLILTEVSAGGTRGEELLRHVRGDEALAATPVVAMSAAPTDLPFDLYLEKPFSPSALRTALGLARPAGEADRPPRRARLLAPVDEHHGPALRISDALRAVMVRTVIDEALAAHTA